MTANCKWLIPRVISLTLVLRPVHTDQTCWSNMFDPFELNVQSNMLDSVGRCWTVLEDVG